jgi:hypothetical protein
MALRTAAGLLRDGVAVPVRELDAIHQDLSASLLRVATLPGRYPAIVGLAGKVDLAIGFKQVTSVRRAAVGLTPWRDPAVTPHIGQHESPGGRFGPGLGGVMAAGVMSGLGPGGGLGGYGPGGYGGFAGYGYGGPFGGGLAQLGGLWAFRALGGGLNWSPGGQPHMTPRPDLRRGLLIPETEDLTALTTSGADPTVLALALLTPASGGDPVAYTVLNLPETVTYVYRTGGPSPRAAVNQALDDAGFAAAELHAAASGDLTAARRQDAGSSPLTGALLATIPHDQGWQDQLTGLLTA